MIDKTRPCLWFDGEAEAAANFYVALLPDSRIDKVQRAPTDYPSGGEGAVLVVEFTLAGRSYMAMNGGPGHPFTQAISLSIDCADQTEVDRLWEALTADGGQPVACGWLKDRWGLSWQVVPSALPRLLADPDPARAARVFQAMMGMVKLDVAELERAAAGELQAA
jgi:predicted 3-demethylubiquinone-9 3-methyltransferase (glyoxalase superfamily)